MIGHFDSLLASYDRGALSRRQLLGALAALAAPVAAAAQPAGVMSGRNLHHVNVQVADVARSEAFYRQLFGFKPTRVLQGQDAHGFDLPGGGVLSIQKGTQPGRLDHFCIGVDDFNAERMIAAVKAAGVTSVQPAGRDSFFLRDPDGASVQVSAFDWKA